MSVACWSVLRNQCRSISERRVWLCECVSETFCTGRASVSGLWISAVQGWRSGRQKCLAGVTRRQGLAFDARPSWFWVPLKFWVWNFGVCGFFFLWLNPQKCRVCCFWGKCVIGGTQQVGCAGGLQNLLPASREFEDEGTTRDHPVVLHIAGSWLSPTYSYACVLFLQSFVFQGTIRSSRTKRCKIRPDTRAQAMAGDWVSFASSSRDTRTSGKLKCPGAENPLLPLASRGTWRGLRERCLRCPVGTRPSTGHGCERLLGRRSGQWKREGEKERENMPERLKKKTSFQSSHQWLDERSLRWLPVKVSLFFFFLKRKSFFKCSLLSTVGDGSPG